MSSPDLDALIVEHLADLDQVGARIDAIEARLFTAIGKKMKKWADQNGWIGHFDYPTDGGWSEWDIWIAPVDWRTADTPIDDDNFDGSFTLSVGDGDTEAGAAGEDWFYLTRLTQTGVGKIGLRFDRPDFVKPKQWKQAFSHLRENISDQPFVAIMSSGTPAFFLPFKIDPQVLSAALREEDLDSALVSFEAALETMLHAKPQFDQVLQYLRSLTG